MSQLFPRTAVGGVSLPRLIIGANWITGFSHRGPAADQAIRAQHALLFWSMMSTLCWVFLNTTPT